MSIFPFVELRYKRDIQPVWSFTIEMVINGKKQKQKQKTVSKMLDSRLGILIDMIEGIN